MVVQRAHRTPLDEAGPFVVDRPTDVVRPAAVRYGDVPPAFRPLWGRVCRCRREGWHGEGRAPVALDRGPIKPWSVSETLVSLASPPLPAGCRRGVPHVWIRMWSYERIEPR